MENNKLLRTCPECGDKISGRVDKKFCCDQCRNLYNNRQKSNDSNLVRNINSLLKKNRRILQDLNPKAAKVLVSKESLLVKGFHFSYHTHTYTTKKGLVYYFCYEQGYLFLEEKNQYLLVTTPEDKD